MKNGIIIVVVLAVLAGAGAFYFSQKESGPGPLDTFTQCLKDSGTVFYGAFWCPHCQVQKKMFGNSVKLLPYVECSNPDGKTQKQECKDKGVTSYPTWEFPDGSRLTGEVALETLAEKTSCTLPAN
jgi:hypothetical protein